MNRPVLLIAVCVGWLCIAHLQAAEVPKVIEIKGEGIGFRFASLSPDGAKLVTGAGNTARVWCANTGQELLALRHPDRVLQATFSPDGKRIAVSNVDSTDRTLCAAGQEWRAVNCVTRIWCVESGQELHKIDGWRPVFSSDGKRVITMTGNHIAGNWAVHVWDVASGEELHKFKGIGVMAIAGGISSGSVSCDGKKILTMSTNADVHIFDAALGIELTVHIWDAESGKELQRWENDGPGSVFAFSPDGKKIAARGAGLFSVRIWDIESGEEVQKLEGHELWVDSIAFSPDGKKVVTTSSDETARIWCVESGRELQRLQGDPNDRHRNVLFVIPPPLGRDGYAKVQFDYAAFSPDGTKVFTTGGHIDGVIRVWNVASGRELHVLEGHASGDTLRFIVSSDGKKMVTHAGSFTVLIWDLERLPSRPAIRDF